MRRQPLLNMCSTATDDAKKDFIRQVGTIDCEDNIPGIVK